MQDGDLIGFLTLGYRGRTGRFSRRQITLAKGLSHHVLAALRNARTMRSLRDVNQVKTDFIAAVSHDLRTPLHVLIGYAEMLAEGAAGALNAEQTELVSRLREGALRFQDLIDDVLDVARLDAGQDVVESAPVVLQEICTDLSDELEVLRKPEVELRFEVGDVVVLSDGVKVRTILRNLLSNALKFTRRGSVEVTARHADDELLLRVRDTGPGIGEDDRPRIFEMFLQGDAGRRSGGSGLGLGLYLVRRLADMLGGRVELVSAEPGETVFEVRLPVRSAPRPPDARP
jgi:signal transduction histidine kinase